MRAAHDPHYIEFIARLRNVRKSKGLTQADLAELLNKPQSYVSKVETCERRIDVIEAARWCRVLEVSLEDALPDELKTAKGERPTKTKRGKR
jgi:transcriptional regulator with XRE-family HTH domain